MVGFLQIPTIEGAREEEKIQASSDSKKPFVSEDSLDLYPPQLEDFSSSSFLDFDSINDWFIEGYPEFRGDQNMADFGVDFSSVEGELGACKEGFEVGGNGVCKKDKIGGGKEGSFWGLGEEMGETRVEMGTEAVDEEINLQGILGGDDSGRKSGDLGCLIEQQMEKVSLDVVSNCLVPVVVSENVVVENVGGDASVLDGGDVMRVNVNKAKINKTKSEEDDSGSDSDTESSLVSLSSPSSSSDEEEDDEDSGAMSGERKSKNEKDIVDKEIDREEGEIMLSDADEMVGWSDNEEDGSGSGTIGPITSKNEIKVLPPVPAVSATLQPHHQTLPVGIILSIIGSQVIVEGVEKHNPLNEGSILWITESRLPLGIIDEIFGPVKNPYYIVRYNAESEVPTGIQQGTLVSFVPEFAKHVLNDKSLYQKGYDASGENDEELSDVAEFSDDEKESEYRRMLKMKKRGTNESKPGKKRKEKRQVKNQTGNWNRHRDPAAQTPLGGDKVPVTEDRHLVPPVATSLNQDNYSHSASQKHDLPVNQAMVPPFPQAPRFCAPNGIWSNGFPHQQHQNIGLPSGLPANGMLWMQQNGPYQIFQTPLQSNMAFQQQISTIPGLGLNFNALNGQPNFGVSPSLGPWSTSLDQNTLNPSQFGMALQPVHSQGSQISPNFQTSQGSQVSPNFQTSQGLQVSPNFQTSQGSQISPNFQTSPATLNFNQGRGGGRGRHRGGRFGGGRGWYQSR